MKKLAFVLIGALGFAATPLVAADAPRGSVMEVHSCELYAGGCVVSSEQPQDGRYMLRAWDFSGGSFNGVDLQGLKFGVLQFSSDNLAEAKSLSGDAVVYLPAGTTPAQRDALVAWLKSSQPDFHPTKLKTQVVPIVFAKAAAGYIFTAGSRVSVETGSLESCPSGSCGDSLWYEPRAVTGPFTVAVNRVLTVHEPLLKLTWDQGSSRNIFLARFGETATANKSYVSLAELCGPARTLF